MPRPCAAGAVAKERKATASSVSSMAMCAMISFAEQKTKLNVMREVQTSYADLESARVRVKAMQDSVTQAQEILKNEQTKYEVGRSVINFVLEAEAGLRTSQSLLYQAQRSESIAALSLELATGSINTDSPGLHQ
jgi:outer membrane protein TolC